MTKIKRINPRKWLKKVSLDSKCVIEFGSRFGDKLTLMPDKIKKIGIEIYKPDQDKSVCEYIKILGDIREYRQLLLNDSRVNTNDYDTALLVDIIEHLYKEDAIKLIKQIQEDFNKIILYVPEGQHEQEPFDANEHQRHLSYWYSKDIKNLNFQEIILGTNQYTPKPNKTTGAFFAVWRKK